MSIKSQDQMYKDALEYHQNPAGKVSIKATKAMDTQLDLSLAYSPGVAAPCLEIEKDPMTSYDYTARGNIVAVISNGTAVLGLGNIGALASKPVMEGKAVLFKKFSDIDSVDIEINEKDPKKLIQIIKSLEPSFGAINLEDIKAPECFEIENTLKEEMNIPVFHDDQHGTAIIVTAAFKNWLELTGRDPSTLKMVTSGAGASATSCMNLMVGAGLKRENITVCDRNGVIYKGRNEGMNPEKEQFIIETNARTLEDALKGADVLLGLSGAGLVKAPWVATMADAPLLLTLANPTPEIMPEEARAVKPNAIICTGRSDYVNQVNNVLCFPFIFRGALDVGASAINDEMKMACIDAIAGLARKEITSEVAAIYSQETLSFGSDYLIPKPFDPRLMVDLPMAVAKAACDSGVARLPITDWDEYKNKLQSMYIRSRPIMRPVIDRARKDPKRVVFCEGESRRTLQAVQMMSDEKLVKPTIIGRASKIDENIKHLGLKIEKGQHFEILDPSIYENKQRYTSEYYDIMSRKGISQNEARNALRVNTTVIGSMAVRSGDADALICGTQGNYDRHLRRIIEVIGLCENSPAPASLSALILDQGPLFLSDTHVTQDPNASQIADIAIMAAKEVRRFGIDPKVALLSHSSFGTSNHPSALKMREALDIIHQRAPDLEVDGEMHGDAAINERIRNIVMQDSSLSGNANLLIMPDRDVAHITFNLLKHTSKCVSVGPLLLGTRSPAHILTPSVTPRGILNAATMACVAAQK